MKRTKFELLEHVFSIYLKGFAILCIFIVLYSILPTLYAYSYDYVFGEQVIEDTVSDVVGNETDPNKVALTIMSWEQDYFMNPFSHYNPDSKLQKYGIYNIDGYRLFIRNVPPSWAIHSKMANCGEYALVFVALMNQAGYDARFIRSAGGDHCWAEYTYDGYTIAVDPSANYVIGNRKNDFEARMGTSFQYIESSDLEGNSYGITNEYINTTNLTVFVFENDKPINDAKVILYSSYLIDQKGSRYDKITKDVSENTNLNGYCYFDIGYGNYTLEIEDSYLFLLEKEYIKNVNISKKYKEPLFVDLGLSKSKIEIIDIV
ncbi:hypothetical protein HNV12_15640 [Methanococcoides sp. SA1]|nr:hypothetical protein [Methanococcoides sp. SA1]